jgi:hypothetical protein
VHRKDIVAPSYYQKVYSTLPTSSFRKIYHTAQHIPPHNENHIPPPRPTSHSKYPKTSNSTFSFTTHLFTPNLCITGICQRKTYLTPLTSIANTPCPQYIKLVLVSLRQETRSAGPVERFHATLSMLSDFAEVDHGDGMRIYAVELLCIAREGAVRWLMMMALILSVGIEEDRVGMLVAGG